MGPTGQESGDNQRQTGCGLSRCPHCAPYFLCRRKRFSHLTFHDDLTTLPVGVFSGLSNVVFMDISYTGLQYLPAGVFSGLSGLKKL